MAKAVDSDTNIFQLLKRALKERRETLAQAKNSGAPNSDSPAQERDNDPNSNPGKNSL